MKRSIRTRITLIVLALIAIMLSAICIVNVFFLERYYTDQKIRVMEHAYENIDAAVMERVNEGKSVREVITHEMVREWEIFSQNSKKNRREEANGESQESGNKQDSEAQEHEIDESIREEIEHSLLGTFRRYGEKNNIMMLLVDSETGETLLNYGRSGDFLAQRLQQYILGQGSSRDSELMRKHDNYVIEKNSDTRFGNQYLESWGYFSDNNTLFMMRMPLSSIRESALLSNRFTVYVGIVMLILGSTVMYFVTWRVTEPILKLAAVSERMSNLDFDVFYEGDSQDEIGILGRSMNSMSVRLKDTILELKEANARLQKDIQEKIEIDDMRKEFIANVSHELKTPIALIQGYAEGLTEGLAEDTESRNYYCEVIMDEAGKMNKLVRQLLTLTALEFGNDAPNQTVFDLKELIRSLVNSARILLEQKQAKVEIVCEDELLVYADEFKIEEVLTNYFNNAMNHLSGARQIRITAQKQDGVVKVTVFNTGDAIPEEALPNLWTKFYKVDKARTREYGGSGIGLSIVKAIMDAHHQTCGVENVKDGVQFWFTLAAGQKME